MHGDGQGLWSGYIVAAGPGRPDPPVGQVAVAGVDDVTLRKRLHYAAVLVNLNTRRPVDVLAKRRVATAVSARIPRTRSGRRSTRCCQTRHA